MEVRRSPLTKALTPTETPKNKSITQRRHKKTSIIEQMRTDLGWPFGVTTATHPVWLYRFTGSKLSYSPQKLWNQKDIHFKLSYCSNLPSIKCTHMRVYMCITSFSLPKAIFIVFIMDLKILATWFKESYITICFISIASEIFICSLQMYIEQKNSENFGPPLLDYLVLLWCFEHKKSVRFHANLRSLGKN